MVLMVPEMPIDMAANVGSGGVHSVPTVIQRSLSQLEMERYLGLYSGSGGTPSAFFITPISGADNVLVEAQTTSSMSLSDALDYILETFILTKVELAEACKVQSRKTLYNWIDGSVEPRAENINRIFNLYMIAQGWREQGFNFSKALLRQPVVDNQSVIDLLKSDELNQNMIVFAGSRLELTSGVSKQLEDPFA